MLSNNQQKITIVNNDIEHKGQYIFNNEDYTSYFELLETTINLYCDQYKNTKTIFDLFICCSNNNHITLCALNKAVNIFFEKDNYIKALDLCEIGIKYLSGEMDFNNLIKLDIEIKKELINFFNLYKLVYISKMNLEKKSKEI